MNDYIYICINYNSKNLLYKTQETKREYLISWPHLNILSILAV